MLSVGANSSCSHVEGDVGGNPSLLRSSNFVSKVLGNPSFLSRLRKDTDELSDRALPVPV